MNSLVKNINKPNTFKNYFDSIKNFSIYSLDDLFSLYENYINFLENKKKINHKFDINSQIKNNDYNYDIKSNYDNSILKSELSNYNNWSNTIETGLLKKTEYKRQVSVKDFSGCFIYLNIPFELFNLFHYMPNSDIGIIRYFVNYISENKKWDDVKFVNEKIKEIDNHVPFWNHNFPIFIFKDILKNGILMPLTNNFDTFLAGGIHRYVCQSLCKRPTPMFIKIPHIEYRGDLNTSWFINENEFILPSNFPLFTKPNGSNLLHFLIFKINLKTQIIKFLLTPKRTREINEDYLEIGYCDYKTDTYQLYEF